MNYLTQCLAILFTIITITVTCPPNSHAIEDAIIAVVNDELITLKDLKDYIQSTYIGLVAEGMSDTQIQSIMKDMEVNGTNKLIEDKLILSQSNIMGITVREGIIDESIEEMELKYGSEQKLIDALIQNGATLTDLRNKIRDQLKIKFIIDHEVRSQVYVNPQEITAYYEENKDQFNINERINIESIFIAFGDNKKNALSKTVDVFKEVVAEKKDFSAILEEHSDTASVGIVSRGQFLPEIEDIVFNLSVDEVSHLVEVENGIYIFKLLGKISAQVSTLEDVKKSIKEKLYNQKMKVQFIEWLDTLKKDAYIEIKK